MATSKPSALHLPRNMGLSTSYPRDLASPDRSRAHEGVTSCRHSASHPCTASKPSQKLTSGSTCRIFCVKIFTSTRPPSVRLDTSSISSSSSPTSTHTGYTSSPAPPCRSCMLHVSVNRRYHFRRARRTSRQLFVINNFFSSTVI